MPSLVGLGSRYISENVGATVNVQFDPVVISLVTAKQNSLKKSYYTGFSVLMLSCFGENTKSFHNIFLSSQNDPHTFLNLRNLYQF